MDKLIENFLNDVTAKNIVQISNLQINNNKLFFRGYIQEIEEILEENQTSYHQKKVKITIEDDILNDTISLYVYTNEATDILRIDKQILFCLEAVLREDEFVITKLEKISRAQPV